MTDTDKARLADYAQNCGLQVLWWWLGRSQEIRREYNEYHVGRTISIGLRKAREAAGLSRVALSRKSGVSAALICNVERYINVATTLTLTTLLKLANGCDCALFVGMEEWLTAILAWKREPNPQPYRESQIAELAA